MITELKPTKLIAVKVPNGIYKRFDSFGIKLPDGISSGEYKVVGIVTKDKIGFDVKPYSDKYNTGFYREHKEKSFYYLLAANGLYFENPLNWEKKAYLFKGSENSWGHDDLSRWQSFEDKLIKGKLLILEKL